MGKKTGQKGFTLIEMMIAMAVVGILSSMAIPGYVGFQEKSRRASIERTTSASQMELSGWLHSSLSTGRAKDAIEVDTNYDGRVPSGDLSNEDLRLAGVAATYVAARNAPPANDRSPWDETLPLWVLGPAGNGQIGLSQVGNIIYVTAKDLDGNAVFAKRVVTD